MQLTIRRINSMIFGILKIIILKSGDKGENEWKMKSIVVFVVGRVLAMI